MAPTFVRGAHTKGNEALAVLPITAPAAGDTLIAFLTKSTEPTVTPTFSDNTGGTWTVSATKALSKASASGTWMGTKIATGSETEIKGTGGTVVSLAYEQVSGLGALETITNADNIASAKEGSITFTGGKANSYYIVCNGSDASCGTAEAWGGTGPTLTNAETALAARNYTGHAVLTEPISAKTAISKHSAASVMGMLAATFAEAAPEVGYIPPLMPPTFRTPRGLYKPFPLVASEEAAQIILGKATGTLLLTGTSTGTAMQKVLGSATGPLLLTGTSQGLAVQRVLGVATGALLLTGTSKGVAIQRVSGQATGALLLTGTSKATLASVLKGSATGALLLTGTAKGITAQRITAQAAGVLLLTGTAKGAATEGVKASATGALLLTGTAKGQTKEVLLTGAKGTMFLLGKGTGTAAEGGTRKIAIFIFDE